MKRHLEPTVLALHAGGDLPLPARLAAAWHLLRCARCRRQVQAFRRMRQQWKEEAAQLPPGLDWPALEAEMKANIRLGIAAGAIVRGGRQQAQAWRPQWKPAFVVAATLALVLAAGSILERKAPPQPGRTPESEVVLRTTPEGLAVEWGSHEAAVFGAGQTPVAAAVSWDGSARAPFLDEETGQVTIYNVAAQ